MLTRKTVYSTIAVLALATPAFAADTPEETVVTEVVEEAPVGQDDAATSMLPEESNNPTEDLFGAQGGYIHPFLRVEESYTDNVFYLQDETSSWITRFMPGIWLALPRTKELPIQITPNNTSPAGLQTQVKDPDSGTDRYQAFLLGNLDSRIYSEDSDLNSTGGQLQGLFRYNMRSGLSLQALDGYKASQDPLRESTDSNDVREYDSNLAMATADWQMTEKFRTKVSYSNFWLDYDSSTDDVLNRDDNAVDVYTYFTYSPKTSLYLEYKYVDVAYDDASAKDNSQHYGYVGMQWKPSDKLGLNTKVGYQKRDYDSSEYSSKDDDDFAFELDANYRVSDKTGLTFGAYRSSNESDSLTALDKTVSGIRFGYRQDLSEKLAVMVNGLWENADYTYTDGTDRTDDRYYLAPAVQYFFLDWFMAELAYSWDDRTSDLDAYEYTTNTIMFSLNFSM